jgi:hypothetical protein
MAHTALVCIVLPRLGVDCTALQVLGKGSIFRIQLPLMLAWAITIQ